MTWREGDEDGDFEPLTDTTLESAEEEEGSEEETPAPRDNDFDQENMDGDDTPFGTSD